jgi:protein arginine kinase activator
MKCQNCGKDEVSFSFTSNINGNITEKYLCAECAEKLGYSDKQFTKPDATFEEIFAELFGAKINKRMPGGYGVMFPTFIIPTMGMFIPDNDEAGDEAEAGETPSASAAVKQEIDTAMQKRREVNIMREQMAQAAAAEDFEKAAAIRDRIKKLEIGESY